MATTDGDRDYPFEPDVSIDADILALVYHLPMEVFVHLAASCVVKGWMMDDGTLMLNSNQIVAILGQAGYTYRQ